MKDIWTLLAKKYAEQYSKPPKNPQLAALKQLGIYCEAAADGAITVPGNIDLSRRGLEALPDFSGVIVKGSFDCSGNKLTSLKGAPKHVGLWFNCSRNGLTTLEGGPAEVKGGYYCADNKLKNLTGAPRETACFDCSRNPRLSFRGGPEKVSGQFRCRDSGVGSLAFSPRETFYLEVTGAKLKNLRGLPRKFHDINTDFGAFASRKEIPAHLRGAATQPRQPAPAAAETAPPVALKTAINVGRPLSLVRG